MPRALAINVGLALLLAGLLAWHLAGDGGGTEPGEAIGTVTGAAVDTIILRRPGGADLTLEKRNGSWHLSQPFSARASDILVEDLLRLADAPVLGPALPDDDPARYGLDPPRAEIQLDDEVIRLGDLHPFEPSQYAQGPRGLFLIAGSHGVAAGSRVEDFLSRRLLADDEVPVALHLPDGRSYLRGADGRWAGGDTDGVNALVERWRQGFAAASSRVLATPPGQALRIDLEDGRELAFTMVEDDGLLTLIRHDEGLAFHFPASSGRQLLAVP